LISLYSVRISWIIIESTEARPATGLLAEALKNAPHDPDFDLETWTKEWAAVEAEIKAITRANDIAEGCS
jgi:hypothetical protein